MKRILLQTILFANIAISCNQNSNSMTPIDQQVTILEQMAVEMAARFNNYTEQPMYYLQVNKSACRVIVRVNDIPLGFFFIRDEGQTMLIPINTRIFSSGRQTFSIDVYPMRDDELIDRDAHVNVRLLRLANRSLSLNSIEELMVLNLPIDIGRMELPFYTASAEFYAHVPFNHNHVLENLKDLRKIRNLEEKVVQRYKEIRQHLVNYDGVGFERERAFTFYTADRLYLTEDETVNDFLRTFSLFFYPNFFDRRVLPIENYEMMIVGDGRFVLLRERGTMQHVLRITYFENEEEKVENPQNYWIRRHFILLGMPRDSDRLEMIF